MHRTAFIGVTSGMRRAFFWSLKLIPYFRHLRQKELVKPSIMGKECTAMKAKEGSPVTSISATGSSPPHKHFTEAAHCHTN